MEGLPRSFTAQHPNPNFLFNALINNSFSEIEKEFVANDTPLLCLYPSHIIPKASATGVIKSIILAGIIFFLLL